MTITFKCKQCQAVLKKIPVSDKGKMITNFRRAFKIAEAFIEDILLGQVSCVNCGRQMSFRDLQDQEFECVPNISWSQ